jgi:hypothetical protein
MTPLENVGWTTAAYPRFYWYQPIAPGSLVEFALYRATGDRLVEGDLVYQARFPGPFDAGIASLALPQQAGIEPLIPGEQYYWQVSIFCDPHSDERTLAAAGWIERRPVEADLAAALAEADLAEQASLYAEHRYWYDLLDALAMLRQDSASDPDSDPDSDPAIARRWAELLTSVELDVLIEAPFLMPNESEAMSSPPPSDGAAAP